MDDDDVIVMDDRRVAFEAEVKEKNEIINSQLDTISQNLRDLHAKAIDINNALNESKEKIDEVNAKADKTVVALQSSNLRLKQLTSKTGGCEKICPVLCVGLLLLSLIGLLISLL